MITVLVLLALAGPAAGREQPRLPEGITCEQVRYNFAQWAFVGRKAIRAYLRLQGHSKEAIREAEKCL